MSVLPDEPLAPMYLGHVPRRVLEELNEIARREDRSRAAVVRRALEETIRRSHEGETDNLDERR